MAGFAFETYVPPETFNSLADLIVAKTVGGQIELLSGTIPLLRQFLGYFDPPMSASSWLTTR